MNSRQDYELCPRCGVGKILTGHARIHNKREDGEILCPECVIAKIYERLKK